jgi:putative oxidoreductase
LRTTTGAKQDKSCSRTVIPASLAFATYAAPKFTEAGYNCIRRTRQFVRNTQSFRRIEKQHLMNPLTKTQKIVAWVCRIAAAVILLQTLFFKFTAAPESVYIFTKVGLEPYGRIGSGVAELIAAILILIPATTWLGAGLALAVMFGAIFSHLTVLGVQVMGDGGLLFGLALAVAICSAVLLFLQRRRLPIIGVYL